MIEPKIQNKLEILKMKADIANCERIAKTTAEVSLAKALTERAEALKKQVAKAEKELAPVV
jgi:polyhydroxyalkanoate synthesis regulator phasin